RRLHTRFSRDWSSDVCSSDLERELPETVARLSDPSALGENTPEELAAQVQEPIQLRSRDEIGQVAQAFNAVHRSAVRVAAEQARSEERRVGQERGARRQQSR